MTQQSRRLHSLLRGWPEPRIWFRSQSDDFAAWRNCNRGDWMLLLIGKTVGPPGDDSRRPLVRAACECARAALHRLFTGELQARQAVEAAEQWARGEAKLLTVRRVVRAASDSGPYSANIAARAAASTAYRGARAVAVCAFDAAHCAADTFHRDRRPEILRMCSDIVRTHYPAPPRVTR